MACAIAFMGGWVNSYVSALTNEISIDELMTKWRASDNWVFVQNKRYGSYDEIAKTKNGEIETMTIERNGNVVSRIQVREKSSRIFTLYVYDENGYKYYYGRGVGTSGWDWNCTSPNPSRDEGEIEDYFDEEFYIASFKEALEEAIKSPKFKFLLKEENGIYYFEFILNWSEIMINRGLDFWKEMPLGIDYKCALTFGNSTAKVSR